MVIEVLASATVRIDWVAKFCKYRQAEGREYWPVDHNTRAVYVNILLGSESLSVQVLPGDTIELGDVFVKRTSQPTNRPPYR